MRHYINGFFFQRNQSLGVGYDAHGEQRVVVRQGMATLSFVGMIDSTPDPISGIAGGMSDQLGEADLRNIILTDTELRFDKRYEGRDNVIHYQFRKLPDGTWIGQYEGASTGIGVARCVVTPVPDDFLDPDKTLELSGKEKFHDWGGAANRRSK